MEVSAFSLKSDYQIFLQFSELSSNKESLIFENLKSWIVSFQSFISGFFENVVDTLEESSVHAVYCNRTNTGGCCFLRN